MDSNSKTPTFNDVADFVRAWASISNKRQINSDTQFERDLGITGDDGTEMLEAAEKQFGVKLDPDDGGYRTIFGLGPNEYLFSSEGFSIGREGSDLITLFTDTKPSVRRFTVGELYEAMQRALSPNRR